MNNIIDRINLAICDIDKVLVNLDEGLEKQTIMNRRHNLVRCRDRCIKAKELVHNIDNCDVQFSTLGQMYREIAEHYDNAYASLIASMEI